MSSRIRVMAGAHDNGTRTENLSVAGRVSGSWGDPRMLRFMPADTPISFARGAPSLDIVDVEGLREAAQRAFENDPGGTTAYGTAVGYVPLREWISERHG